MPQAAWRTLNTIEWACSYEREAERRASFGRYESQARARESIPRALVRCEPTLAPQPALQGAR
jgi:hypothetical protein